MGTSHSSDFHVVFNRLHQSNWTTFVHTPELHTHSLHKNFIYTYYTECYQKYTMLSFSSTIILFQS